MNSKDSRISYKIVHLNSYVLCDLYKRPRNVKLNVILTDIRNKSPTKPTLIQN